MAGWTQPDRELTCWEGTIQATNGFVGNGSRLTDITVAHVSTTGRTTDDHHAEVHAAEHETGGGDLLNVESIPTLFTAGSVIFSDGTNLTEDNANLFWNNASKELQPNRIRIEADGTQANPALKFNDTNTGFYKSGDSVRFSLNDSTKWTVNATGFGIGTDSPGVQLHTFADDAGDVAQVTIEQDGAGSAGIAFLRTAEQGFYVGVDGADNKFKIGEVTTIGGAVALTIDRDKKVGIGTESPDEKLEVTGNIKVSSATAVGFKGEINSASTFGVDFNANNIGAGNTVMRFLRGSDAGTNFQIFSPGTATTNFLINGINGNVGINTTIPTTQFSVKEKAGISPIGGIMIKLTNKTGSNSVQGQLVHADTSANDAVKLTIADGEECIGVFLEGGVANNAEAWIVISGIADVAMEDNTTATRGNWVRSSITEAGYADATNALPPSPAAFTHFNEIGNCIETVTATGEGNHVLARCVLHFN